MAPGGVNARAEPGSSTYPGRLIWAVPRPHQPSLATGMYIYIYIYIWQRPINRRMRAQWKKKFAGRSGPSRTDLSPAEPSRAEPRQARAEPRRAEPSRGGPSFAVPSRAHPSRCEPKSAKPSRDEPSRRRSTRYIFQKHQFLQ